MRFGLFGDKDEKVAKRSQRRSLQAIESANWHKVKNRRLEYISEAKLKVLYGDLGWDYPTRGERSTKGSLRIKAPVISGSYEKSSGINLAFSLPKLAAKAARELQRVDLVKTYDRCQPGEYILVRFPFFAGTMTVKCNAFERFSNAFWWQGSYRDLTLYISGNVKNLLDDVNQEACTTPAWNPSATDAALELFSMISSAYKTEGEMELQAIVARPFRDSLCDVLSNLNDGTRRGDREGQRAGWRDALLRCDHVERNERGTRIYGSPVWMSCPSLDGDGVGYGWYCIGEGQCGEKYYGEWLGGWTGTYGKMKPSSRVRAVVSRSALSELPIAGEGYTMVERRDMDGFTFWADNAKEMISLQDVPNKEPEMVSLVDLQATWFTENWLEKVVHEHRSSVTRGRRSVTFPG